MDRRSSTHSETRTPAPGGTYTHGTVWATFVPVVNAEGRRTAFEQHMSIATESFHQYLGCIADMPAQGHLAPDGHAWDALRFQGLLRALDCGWEFVGEVSGGIIVRIPSNQANPAEYPMPEHVARHIENERSSAR